MMTPDTFPCQAWYVTEFGLQEVTLTGWVGRQMIWLNCRGTTLALHSAQCFESPEAVVKAEIESANAECMRLRKLLAAAEDKRCDAILLQAEISQKNNSKV